MGKGLRPIKLQRFSVIDTNDPEDMRDTLIDSFGACDFNLQRREDSFRGIGNYLRFETIGLCYCDYSADIRITFPADRFLRQQFALSGRGQTSFGRTHFCVSANETGAVPADTRVCFELDGGFSQLILRIDTAALQIKLAALLGRPVGRDIQFSPDAAPQSHGQARLRRLVTFLANEADREDVSFTHHTIAHFEQLLMVAFVYANPNNFSGLLSRRSPSAGPAQLRTAEEYIEANWNRPIMIEGLAAASGVGANAIVDSFMRTRGYSPTSFLSNFRLEQARRMLRAPTPATTIAGVACLCGFINARHFTQAYRAAFRELPSATLAAARRERSAK